jgi:hypothetical protein
MTEGGAAEKVAPNLAGTQDEAVRSNGYPKLEQ